MNATQTPYSLLEQIRGDFRTRPSLTKPVWPMQGYDPQHTCRSPEIGAQRAEILWKASLGGNINSSPAVGNDGTVFVGTQMAGAAGGWTGGKLFALEPEDGTPRWTFDAKTPIAADPLISADGRSVYFSAGTKGFYSLNTDDGSVAWLIPVDEPAGGAPVADAGGVIYFGDIQGNVRAISPSGVVLWTRTLPAPIYCGSALSIDERTLYIGADNGILYALSTQDGATLWPFRTDGAITSSPAVDAAGNVYFGSIDGNIYSLAASGSKRWDFATGDFVECPPALGRDGTVYCGSDDCFVYALEQGSGTLKWKAKLGDQPRYGFAIGADSTIYIGALDAGLYALSPQSGEILWRYDQVDGGLAATAPAIAAQRVYISFLGRLVALGGVDAKR